VVEHDNDNRGGDTVSQEANLLAALTNRASCLSIEEADASNQGRKDCEAKCVSIEGKETLHVFTAVGV